MKLLLLVTLTCTAAVAGAAPALAATPLQLVRAAAPRTGRGPLGLAVGAFNADKHADLAAVNSSDGTLSILLGKGQGRFAAAGDPIPAGDDPQQVAVGDFNRDGKQDLAVSDRDSSSIAILLGNGTGAFTLASQLTTVIPDDFTYGDPYAVLVGDFNGDGIADIATTTVGPGGRGEVETFTGAGNGSFGTARLVTDKGAGTGSGAGAALADLNGDHRLDLVLVDGYSSDHRVDTLFGTGAGTFVPGPSVAVGMGASSIAVGDFNGDAHQDVAVTDEDDAAVSVLLGNGSGALTAGATVPAGPRPLGLTTGDFNGDKHLDLAVTNVDDHGVTLLLGTGKGAFAATKAITVGSSPQSVVAGRFDGDAVDDLAADNFNDTTVSVLISSAPRTVKLKRHGRSASGAVSSRSSKCERSQRVQLRRGGRTVRRTTTDTHGRFAFGGTLRDGSYTAAVKATNGCLAGASKTLVLG